MEKILLLVQHIICILKGGGSWGAVPASALCFTLAGSPRILIMIMKLSIYMGNYKACHQFVNHNSNDLGCVGCSQLGRMMPSTPHTQDKSQKDDLSVPG